MLKLYYTANRIYVRRNDNIIGSFPIGNMKLHRILTFNLPAVLTCGGAFECLFYCYALRAEKRFPNTAASRLRNLDMAMSSAFPDILSRVVNLAEDKGVLITRPHESGDFYGQKYLDDWIDLMINKPTIKFYAYTRSAHLDFSAAPKNFNLLYSTGGKFDHLIPPLARKCTTFDKDEKPPLDYVVCPCVRGRSTDMCGSVCYICPNGIKSVALHKH